MKRILAVTLAVGALWGASACESEEEPAPAEFERVMGQKVDGVPSPTQRFQENWQRARQQEEIARLERQVRDLEKDSSFYDRR